MGTQSKSARIHDPMQQMLGRKGDSGAFPSINLCNVFPGSTLSHVLG